jgi:hypothetical protein
MADADDPAPEQEPEPTAAPAPEPEMTPADAQLPGREQQLQQAQEQLHELEQFLMLVDSADETRSYMATYAELMVEISRLSAAPSEIPAHLKCPLSMELMRVPTMSIQTGHTFELSFINRCDTHPFTRGSLEGLTPNRGVLEAVNLYCEEHPENEEVIERQAAVAEIDRQTDEARRAAAAADAAAHAQLVGHLSRWLSSALGNPRVTYSRLFVPFLHAALETDPAVMRDYFRYIRAWREILGAGWDDLVARYRTGLRGHRINGIDGLGYFRAAEQERLVYMSGAPSAQFMNLIEQWQLHHPGPAAGKGKGKGKHAAPAAPAPGTMTADEAHSIAQQFVEQCIDNAWSILSGGTTEAQAGMPHLFDNSRHVH